MSVTTLQETIKLNSGGCLNRFSSAILPVFCGLDDVPCSQIKNSAILGVMAPIFSKRLAGPSSVRDCILVLLTILLAQWIGGIKAALVRCKFHFKAKLKLIHRCLLRHKTINLALPTQKADDGFHFFSRMVTFYSNARDGTLIIKREID